MTATADAEQQVDVVRDVVYRVVPGFRPLSLDLYRGDRPQALCVYLHGGGWRMGSRRHGPGPLSPDSSRLFHRMAARGLAVATVDYRLSGEARFPAQSEDVAAACRFLADETALGVTGLPLVTWGVSAGGQLAALRALDSAAPAVRACIAWYAPSDLAALPDDIESAGGEADRGPGSREALLLGAPAARVADTARAASPAFRVHPAAPPFLLVHGEDDVDVPAEQSRRLERALSGAGVPVTLCTIPGQGHLLTTLPRDDVEALVDDGIDFAIAEALS